MKRDLRVFGVMVVCVMLVWSAGCGKKEDAPDAAAPAAPSTTRQEVTTPETPAPAAPAGTPASAPTTTESAAETTTPDYEAMAAKNAEALKAMNQGQDIQPVTPETIKGFLPATLAGMKCTDSDARQMSMMGVNVVSGSAEYETTDGAGTLDLMITDLGNVSGVMRMGMTGWAMAQVDNQTETGYEKTSTYQGHKAYEDYDRQEKAGSFRVFAGDRFVVEVSGDNVTMEAIKQAMGQVDLKKLLESAK